ncbi:uncharacterized protein [Miscanthus floridulus]|uniref:uncharacterized protein n=1 Tax=Miscanthus floridulus TaxID=154761 RepID=UPI0034597FCE
MGLARRLENDYCRREVEYRSQILEHQNTIVELQHDVHCINNIINPIPPPVAMEEEKEDPEIFMEDDGWEEEEEEEEQLVPMDNDEANAMSGVDSDHSKSLTIASQPALGAELLSQALKSAYANLSLANPSKEPITNKATDTPPRKTSPQEQRSDDSPVEEDPVDTDTQTALNSSTLSYSFNFEEYIDENKRSSSAISSQDILLDETKNQLKDMLPMLERNIANLVQDADPMRKIFLAIKDDLPPNLAEALISLSNIKDQAPKVKKAQRNLTDHEALMAKKNSNKQEAKELAQLINNLKNSSSKIESELTQLRIRRAELEQELESVRATIDYHESNLTQIPNAIKQKKQEMLTKVKEGKAIHSSLESIPRSTKEDKQQIAEVDAIRLKELGAIHDALNL